MPELRALIFDVDGTLADNERDGHWPAFNHAFAEAGLDWHWPDALYRELLAIPGGKERIRFYVEEYHPEAVAPAEREAFVAGLHAAKSRHYQRLLTEGSVSARPGVQRVLSAARSAGLRLGIASTSAQPNVMTLLQQALGPKSSDWFEVIGAGDVVANKKPAPDVYQHVLKELNLPATACLAIEDSVAGAQAAHAAGLTTVVTVNDYTRNQSFPHAALVADHLGDPDQPWTILAGDAGGAACFDLALARHLVQRSIG